MPRRSFRTVDLEAESEGEYWMLLRGFLHLQREAQSGRQAAQRMAGHGSVGWGGAPVRRDEEEGGEPPRKAGPPPPDYFLGFHCAGTQIWGRLRQAGLETKRLYALDRSRVMLKVRCPAARLHEVAEVLRLKVRRPDHTHVPFRASLLEPQHDGTQDPLLRLRGESGLFRSSQRQVIIDFIVRSRIRDSGAQLCESSSLGHQVAARLPLHMHSRLEALYACWVLYWQADNWIHRDGTSMSVQKVSVQEDDHDDEDQDSGPVATPSQNFRKTKKKRTTSGQNMGMHFQPQKTRLPHLLARLLRGALHQPLDSIEEYFGESIAFYFAWVEHCTYHLIFLSLAGVAVFLFQAITWRWDHPARLAYALFVVLWSFFVMVTWRQRSNFLAHRWGTLNFKEEETTRPQFHGTYKWCNIAREWIVEYPMWKRILIYSISWPLTLAITAASLMAVLMAYANRDLLLASYFENDGDFQYQLDVNVIGKVAPIDAVEINRPHLEDANFWIIMFAYPAAVACFLPIINFLFGCLAVKLNNFENYKTESQYRNSLILKIFSFHFVTYFASLYYYAFLTISTSYSMFRVAASLFIYITVVHWSRILMQIYVPLLIHRWRVYKERILIRREQRTLEANINTKSGRPVLTEEQANRRVLLDQAQSLVWEEVMLPEYNKFDDYIYSVTQFAYVTCFSFVFPLAPLIVLFNNLVALRLEALKLCRGRRRPLAQKTGGLGVWEHVLHMVTVAAVLTNCALVAMGTREMSRLRHGLGETTFLLVVVAGEHLLLLVKYWMQSSVHKLPRSVRKILKQERYSHSRRSPEGQRASSETLVERNIDQESAGDDGSERQECIALSQDPSPYMSPSHVNFPLVSENDVEDSITPSVEANDDQMVAFESPLADAGADAEVEQSVAHVVREEKSSEGGDLEAPLDDTVHNDVIASNSDPVPNNIETLRNDDDTSIGCVQSVDSSETNPLHVTGYITADEVHVRNEQDISMPSSLQEKDDTVSVEEYSLPVQREIQNPAPMASSADKQETWHPPYESPPPTCPKTDRYFPNNSYAMYSPEISVESSINGRQEDDSVYMDSPSAPPAPPHWNRQKNVTSDDHDTDTNRHTIIQQMINKMNLSPKRPVKTIQKKNTFEHEINKKRKAILGYDHDTISIASSKQHSAMKMYRSGSCDDSFSKKQKKVYAGSFNEQERWKGKCLPFEKNPIMPHKKELGSSHSVPRHPLPNRTMARRPSPKLSKLLVPLRTPSPQPGSSPRRASSPKFWFKSPSVSRSSSEDAPDLVASLVSKYESAPKVKKISKGHVGNSTFSMGTHAVDPGNRGRKDTVGPLAMKGKIVEYEPSFSHGDVAPIRKFMPHRIHQHKLSPRQMRKKIRSPFGDAGARLNGKGIQRAPVVGKLKIPEQFAMRSVISFSPKVPFRGRSEEEYSPVIETPKFESVIPATPPNAFQWLIGDITPPNLKAKGPFGFLSSHGDGSVHAGKGIDRDKDNLEDVKLPGTEEFERRQKYLVTDTYGEF